MFQISPIEKYEPPPQVCEDKSGKPLGFNSSFTGFLLLASGLIVALAVLVIENILSSFGIDISKFYEKTPVLPLCLNCKNALNPGTQSK